MRRAVLTLIVLGVVCLSAGTASAQIPDDQRPPLVTDYANYPGTPQAFLTPGCDFSGVLNPTFGTQNISTGALFGPVSDLSQLPDLSEADLVRMAWTDVSPACIGSAVSFVVKVALGGSFDPNVDQLTGPNGGYSVDFLEAGPGQITFPMPDLARFGLGCDYQLDAIVGIPLRDVGPSGSFFSEALRVQQGKQTADNRTTVISAKNGTYPVCTVPPTTVPVTTPFSVPPSITVPSSLTVPSISITVPSSITTPDISITAPQTTPRETRPEVETPTAPNFTAPTQPRPPIARTGFPVGMASLAGVALVLIGLMFLAIHRKDKLLDQSP